MVNNVVLVGRITREIELRSTTQGKELCNFTVAVNRNYKNANGQYDADFINCTAFGQQAKFLSQYLGKGRLISVTGRIQTSSYDNQQGQRVYRTDVIADQLSPLDSKQQSNNGFDQQSNQSGFNNQGSFNNSNSAYGNQQTDNQGPMGFMNEAPTNQEPAFTVSNAVDIDEDDLPF